LTEGGGALIGFFMIVSGIIVIVVPIIFILVLVKLLSNKQHYENSRYNNRYDKEKVVDESKNDSNDQDIKS